MIVFFPMLSLGPHGGNRVLVELANNLAAKDVDVTILTTPIYKESKYPLDCRVNVQYVGFGNSKFNYYLLLLSVFFFRKYDLVVVNHFSTFIPALCSSFFFRKKAVNLVQDLEYNFHQGFARIIARRICLASFKMKHLISANDYLSSKLESLGAFVALKVNVGVSDTFFNKNNNVLENKTYDILHFARSQTHKRLELLFCLVRKIENIYPEFKIIFASNDHKAIESVNSKGFDCLTPKSDIELINLIDKSRFYLLVSKHEGFSLPPLECMARGVPLIYFPCGGPSVYTNSGNSFELDESDLDGAAEQIVSVIKYSSSECCQNAKSTAENYKMSTAVDSISTFILKVLSK